ncbi:MAG: hypothetical protein GYA52_01260 [Chloroflexi bacterium]|nr:hypothetical protein [Chloroflexota bacterium]
MRKHTMLTTPNAKRNWQNLILLVASTAIFFLILHLRIPTIFRPMIIQMRYGFTIPIPLLFILMTVILLKQHWANSAGAFLLIVSAFAMALAGLWASGQTEGQVISGILPDSDAALYYFDGLRYINGFQFSFFGARRIFFSAFLGLLLNFTNNNIQLTLAILTLLVAIACYFATCSVRDHFGTIPASLFFVLLFSFARLSVGKLMSENLGIILGCFSLTFFMQYLSKKNTFTLLLASISLVLGLITRAGPVALYPFLMLGIFLLEKGKKSFLKILVISLVAVGIVILSFTVLSTLLSPQGSIPFANFAHSFYGLANGGTGWASIYADHPEVESMVEPARTEAIFSFAIQTIRQNPQKLLSGIAAQYPQIINFPDHKGFFSFFGGENEFVFYIAQSIVFALFFYSIYVLIKKEHYKPYRFFLYGLIGVLITVPLLPFSDFKEMRVYAAAIPFIIIFPTIAISSLLEDLRFRKPDKQATDIFPPIFPYILNILIICSTLLFPYFVWKSSPVRTYQTDQKCQQGTGLVVNVNKSSSLTLLAESELYLDWLPFYHESRFRQNLHNLQYEVVQAFENVRAPDAITSTIDLNSGKAVILIFPHYQDIRDDSTLLVCGYWDDFDFSSHNARLFFVENTIALD